MSKMFDGNNGDDCGDDDDDDGCTSGCVCEGFTS